MRKRLSPDSTGASAFSNPTISKREGEKKMTTDLGDFRKRIYHLNWLNQDIPFGQKWISVQSRLDLLHGFLCQGNPFLVNNVA